MTGDQQPTQSPFYRALTGQKPDEGEKKMTEHPIYEGDEHAQTLGVGGPGFSSVFGGDYAGV